MMKPYDINKKIQLTSKLLFSYSFIAVIHWCLVLIVTGTPLFNKVSSPFGGLNGTVFPSMAPPTARLTYKYLWPNREYVLIPNTLLPVWSVEVLKPKEIYKHLPRIVSYELNSICWGTPKYTEKGWKNKINKC